MDGGFPQLYRNIYREKVKYQFACFRENRRNFDRLPDLSFRGAKWPWQSRSTRPEHGKAFGESVSACHALSVTFGDSSPRGRAKVASLPAMTREGGTCKFVTMPLRMGWVSPSCHCILPVAAGSQVCHCEPCGARRGNLAVRTQNTGKPSAKS